MSVLSCLYVVSLVVIFLEEYMKLVISLEIISCLFFNVFYQYLQVLYGTK